MFMEKDITGYEGIYTISDKAIVKNVKTGKIIKHQKDKDGYPIVDLYKDGKRKSCRVHRLVADKFVENPNNDPIVLHLDNDKSNMDPSNLIWGTTKENHDQAVHDGLIGKPGVKKEYLITDSNGNNITPFVFYGQKTIADIIGHGSDNTIRRLINTHREIKHGLYKGFYVIREENR